MPLHPGQYAAMLGQKIRSTNAKVWLVNTGWIGGPYGEGRRIRLSLTRSMITAALEGKLDQVEYHQHPVFGISVPESCPGVPSELLDPKKTWSDSLRYDEKARELAGRFIRNFEQFQSGVSKEILAAGPVL
jgi:phosphoenolpyruvate carboxykinase (ATP)